jgi:hypothetical protein
VGGIVKQKVYAIFAMSSGKNEIPERLGRESPIMTKPTREGLVDEATALLVIGEELPIRIMDSRVERLKLWKNGLLNEPIVEHTTLSKPYEFEGHEYG